MKILDKYIVKNFLIGYCISFCVLMGLVIIIDLFITLDEFTERADLGAIAVMKNILSYYCIHSTVYFRDFAGMITIIAAVFSLVKMVRNNELVAMMASGVSLKRIIAPIILLSLLFTGLLVIDQELIIPPLADKLVRSQDALPGQETYDVWFIADENGSLICSQQFDVETSTLRNPTIILRSKVPDSPQWITTGYIKAKKAVYNVKTAQWDLFNGRIIEKDSISPPKPIASYTTDITPRQIPVRRKVEHIPLLSSRQLSALAAQGTNIKNRAQLYSQKHFRVTDPIINLSMLMLSLSILVCRDPKTMKSAITISFTATGACLMVTFICKLFATEVIFGNKVMPEMWAWIPVFIFAPIAFIKFDSMKT